jgi:hypothetical protein
MVNRMVPFLYSLSAGFWPHLTSWLGCLTRQVPARDQGWWTFHDIAPLGGNGSIRDLHRSIVAYLASYGHVMASLVVHTLLLFCGPSIYITNFVATPVC